MGAQNGMSARHIHCAQILCAHIMRKLRSVSSVSEDVAFGSRDGEAVMLLELRGLIPFYIGRTVLKRLFRKVLRTQN